MCVYCTCTEFLETSSSSVFLSGGSLIHRCSLERAFLQGLVKSLVSRNKECPFQCFPSVRKNLFCRLVKFSTAVSGFTAR